MSNTIISTYFPDLTERQKQQMDALDLLYRQWNERVNVISRKDMDNLYLHHVLHSLAIAKVHPFEPGNRIIDVGCGGGFPGIPLAILYPETEFKMVDSVGKKVNVVKNIAQELGLENIETFHSRIEAVDIKCDCIVSRAVTELKPFIGWTWNKIKGGGGNGILCLKGGDLAEEISEGIRGVKGIGTVKLFNINDYFAEDFFETKRVLYIKKG